MIRRQTELSKVEAELFGGPGKLHSDILLSKEEFFGKGRLFIAWLEYALAPIPTMENLRSIIF